MMSLRKFTVSLTALAFAGLLGCSSGGGNAIAPALSAVSASASPGASDSASATPGASSALVPAPTTAPVNPTAALVNPTTPQPANPTAGIQTTAAAPGAPLPSLSNSPEKALADSGPKGQAYLKLIHDGGIPGNSQVDGLYILFAQATCQAKLKGDSRESILVQFDQIGQTLAANTHLTARQISELFVSSAERTFC
ncbi:MAG: hypothetical protein ACXVGB_11255 [Mycobacteriaceae bacterium]